MWATGCRQVIVNNVTGGTVVTNQIFCAPANPLEFTESVASTGDGLETYQWQSSTTDCSTNFSNIVGATATTYDPPAGLTTTTFYRRVTTSTLNSILCTANSNCITVTISPDNTVGPPSPTPIVCINTLMINITHTTTGATGIANDGIAGANGLPPGVAASWAANTITISGTPTVAGTFNYSILLTGGCGTTNATGMITVAPDNTATLTSGAGTNVQSVVINQAMATPITYSTIGATGISNNGVAGANGLPAGVSATWAANVITIGGTPTALGVFNYTVTLTGGCGNMTATGTITVVACSITLSSAAGTDAQTVCNNTPIINITYATAGATGASFAGLPAGVNGAWAANVATIIGTPTAVGTFNYTVTLTGGGCGAFNATGTITVNPIPQVDPVVNQTYCAGAVVPSVVFSSSVVGATFAWSRTVTRAGYWIGTNQWYR